MGEMADMAIEHAMTAEEDRFAYFSGEMSEGEAYDLGIIDERGYTNSPPMFSSTPRKTCAHCGHRDLHWRETDAGWRLHTMGGELHVCKEYVSPRAPVITNPGTPSARLTWLLHELGERLGHPNPLLSAPPEAELLKRLDIFLEALDPRE